jgi:polygalacturonase
MLKNKSKIFRILFTLLFIASIVIPVSSPIIANAATRDITTYGATPNDSTDDTSAIQNAINAATAGDTIYIPNGTFNISGTITGKSGIKICGDNGCNPGDNTKQLLKC